MLTGKYARAVRGKDKFVTTGVVCGSGNVASWWVMNVRGLDATNLDRFTTPTPSSKVPPVGIE
jgi:hypothetical protein